MSVDVRVSPADIGELEIVESNQEPGRRLVGHFRAFGAERRLEIVGWVFAEGLAATDVVVVAEGVDAAVSPVAAARPDVAEKYPGQPAAPSCGFRVELLAEGHGSSRLEIFAVLEDQTREPLGSILCRSRS